MIGEPVFPLLRPEHLPTRTDVAAFVRSRSGDLRRPLLPAAVHGDEATALAAVRSALAAVPLPADTVLGGPDEIESSGNRENDEAFQIVRVDGDRPQLFVHSVLNGHELLLQEVVTGGTDLAGSQWMNLRRGLLTMLDRDVGPAAGPPWRPVAKRAGLPSSAVLDRWVRGHRLFMVMIQGLVQTFTELTDDLRDGNGDPAGALDRAVLLMRASEAALRFAGDFTPNEYDAVVRPTLMPPQAPPGMSGVHWRDHEFLVGRLGAAQRLLEGVDPSLVALRATFRQAYADVYDAHRYVCARFVGEEASSLLMAKSKQSAAGVLGRYKQARLQHIPE